MKKNLGLFAVALLGSVLAQHASGMDVETIKDSKTGKVYFCANATCAGNATCMGAGNAGCGGLNKCVKELGYPIGWVGAPNKERCEKEGGGKWMLFKKEYSIKGGNVAPLAVKKDSKK